MTKVPDEQSPEKLPLTPEQAKAVLAEGSTVHSFMQAGPILIGCDYQRSTAEQVIEQAEHVEVAGPAARGMGHGVAVTRKNGEVVFLAHEEEVLASYERLLTAGK
jgi:hypothetical protein